MELDVLVPSLAGVVIRSVIQQPHAITVELECTHSTACCPICSHPSNRIHSGYVRTIRDLPWADKAITLKIGVRRFRCEQQNCPRKIFAERLHPSIEAYARRTTRLEQRLQQLALSLGGEGICRLAPLLGFGSISGDTLLRIERKTPLPTAGDVTILGIDEFAYRKGCTYGTILVDLEKKRPIDVLVNNSVETVANWLNQHPEIKVVSRDRAIAFAEAIRKGAPQAIQVADRWHLLKNLSDALKLVLEKDRSALQAVTLAQQEQKKQQQQQNRLAQPDLQPSTNKAQENYTQTWQLHQQGWSIRKTSIQLGISRNTVRKYLRSSCPPTKKKANTGMGYSRSSLNTGEWTYLAQRWQQGEKSSTKLWRELKAQGYQGSQPCIFRALKHFPPHPIDPIEQAQKNATPPLATRKALSILMQHPEKLTEKDQFLLGQLLKHHPLIAKAYPLVQSFGELIRERQAHLLANWILRVKESSIEPLKRFVFGLEKDFEAVYNACSMDWSNGQVEGQVNRLKLIKRQMYGRAKLDLLKKRVVFRSVA